MLSIQTEIPVRFNEVDALGIVWHGHYIRYFEDGREAFGKKYNLSYLSIHAEGYVPVIVKAHLEYKQPIKYGDSVIIESTFVNRPSAKIEFQFRLYRKSDNKLIATGYTIQVFVDAKDRELSWIVPPFYEDWKKKYHDQL